MKGIWEQMDKKPEVSKQTIAEKIDEIFSTPTHRERTFIMRTGRGGYDLFAIAMEEAGGFKRVYAGKRIPRFLNKNNFQVDYTGRNYRLVKINLENPNE